MQSINNIIYSQIVDELRGIQVTIPPHVLAEIETRREIKSAERFATIPAPPPADELDWSEIFEE